MPDSRPTSGQQILEMMGGFRPACIIGAGAELDIWDRLGDKILSAEALARLLDCDLRAITMLLDAVVALGLLAKTEGGYSVPGDLRPLMTEGSPQTVLPMIRHQMNVMRGWSQLAWVAKSGVPVPRQASIRGFEADRAAFIAAMHSVSQMFADDLITQLGPMRFRHMLDVGGASGTWTLAFLRAVPGAKATIFDLPDAIRQARERMKKSEFASRVTLVSGDFYSDDLPRGSDFAWVSAIAHQHSRRHNRDLFLKVFKALEPQGRIAIRDIVMEHCRTSPRDGALFAINMLVNTESGGTFTFEEFAEDLRAAEFIEPRLAVRGETMNSIIMADKPR
jgi:SAM-dependent methyltransferase